MTRRADFYRADRQMLLIAAAAIGQPREVVVGLVEIMTDIMDAADQPAIGKKRRKLALRIKMAAFAAGVTALRGNGRPIDDIIAELATPAGISRKDLKAFRDRLNRNLSDSYSRVFYDEYLRRFQGKSESEIVRELGQVVMYLTPD
jgi:hypothetical protein